MLGQANANDAFGPALLRPLIALAKTWQRLMSDWSSLYRPEKHYMRGPGPKWREKCARQEYTMANPLVRSSPRISSIAIVYLTASEMLVEAQK